uniref:PB1 domain-containing protein n=1 Tax=Capra hircus TaxID=9925 RepID=A0A8C2R6V8_CAPHI
LTLSFCPSEARSGARMGVSAPGDLLITSLDSATTFDELCAEVREMCRLHPGHPLTLKWVDNEGDPCTVSSQMELEEAFRLSCQHKDEGLTLHGQCRPVGALGVGVGTWALC